MHRSIAFFPFASRKLSRGLSGGGKSIETAFISLFLAAAALAQTARIEGEVFDAVTHQPLSDTRVSLRAASPLPQDVPKEATTGSGGGFSFDGLRGGGWYELYFKHQGYSNLGTGDLRKIVEVSDGTAVNVKIELVPAASVAGHILDENGKPLNNCTIEPRPVDVFRSRVPMNKGGSRADGFYRIAEIYPGRYWITAQCRMPVLHGSSGQAESFPATAYAVRFYPGETDVRAAEILTLSPGEEKSGLDIRMAPVHLTSIRGVIAPGSADWRGRRDLGIALVPLDPRDPFPSGYEPRIDLDNGSFELRRVPPGSYRLLVFSQKLARGGSQPGEGDRIGGETRVDAAGHPLEVMVELHRAVDIQGRIEIQRGKEPHQQIDPHYLLVQLVSDYLIGDPPPAVQLKEDGTFTIKSVPPGQWRIKLSNQPIFVKSMWFGNDNTRGGYLDLTSGAIKPLRIIASTNLGTIQGTAPPESWLLCARLDETFQMPAVGAILVSANGKFGLPGLAPGTYRLNVGDPHGPMPEEGSLDVTVGEGETATVELRTGRRQ